MKLSFKKIAILSLVGLFLTAAMFCCCFTDIVQAQEPTPSCHQTTQDTESSKNTEDCECDQSFVFVKESASFKGSLLQVAAISLDQLLSSDVYHSTKEDAYQAPPLVYDTLPHYIKYSILRI